GTLAAALSHRLKGSLLKPAAQVLVYPSLGGDYHQLESYQCNALAPLLTSDDIKFYRETRSAPGDHPENDPEFYPLVAPDFTDLPITTCISADIDPLRDDSEEYCKKINLAGGSATWINEPGVTHDFIRARHISERASDAFDDIITAINPKARTKTR
ncbi:MAG: alpha/beta hydrolase fold domain-containing protein, partial [Pseudomonadota bacterium]